MIRRVVGVVAVAALTFVALLPSASAATRKDVTVTMTLSSEVRTALRLRPAS